MFRFAVIVLAFFTFAYSQVVSAQGAVSDKAYRLFLARVTTFSSGNLAFASTGAVLASSAPVVFSAPTFTAGGAAVTTAARVAVGAGSAAVSVVGSASGPAVYAGFRALVGGPLGLALLASPIIIDWLSDSGIRINPGTGQPSLPSTDVSSQCTAAFNSDFANLSIAYQCNGSSALRKFARVAGNNCQGVVVCNLYGPLEERIVINHNKLDGVPPKYQDSTFDDISQYMDKPTPPAVMRELLEKGAKIEVVPRFINGPEYVPLPSETTVTETSEKITTTEKQKGVKLEYKTATDPVTGQPAPYVQATPKETTTVKEKDKATGQEKVISVTDTEGGDKPKADPQEIETCGLPGKPACIVDETGMPDQAAIDAKMDSQKAKNVYKDIDDMAKDPTTKMPVHPIINWSFALPTGCAVIPLPAFEPFIQPIDVCQFKPMFHDVMSIVWLFGGIFGAISLFMKNALSH